MGVELWGRKSVTPMIFDWLDDLLIFFFKIIIIINKGLLLLSLHILASFGAYWNNLIYVLVISLDQLYKVALLATPLKIFESLLRISLICSYYNALVVFVQTRSWYAST